MNSNNDCGQVFNIVHIRDGSTMQATHAVTGMVIFVQVLKAEEGNGGTHQQKSCNVTHYFKHYILGKGT